MLPLHNPFGASYLADPHAVHRKLRELGPVHRITLPGGASAWLVTRESDVRQLLADPRLSIDKRSSGSGYTGFSLPPALDANLLNLDPPDHTRLRRLVSHAFTRSRVDGLRNSIQDEANRLLNKMGTNGCTDLIGEFATPLPLTVIGDLLGIPELARTQFREWTENLLAPDPTQPNQAGLAVKHMERFFVDLIDDKRITSSDDLVSDLILVRDGNNDKLTEDELLSLAFLIFWAGYESSVHLIGNSLLALLQDPDQLEIIRASQELTDQALEELIRYAHPSQFAIRRFSLEDITLDGVSIPAGETVLLGIASANRDSRRYSSPDSIDLSRKENPHLAFGHGIHYCLGAPLARLEARIALESIIRHFPNIELAIPSDELRWRSSFREHGLEALPVLVS